MRERKVADICAALAMNTLQSGDKRKPDGITLSSKDIRLEIVDSNNLEKAKTNEQIQAWSFFAAVTVLHEIVHAGRLANNMDGGKEKIEKGWQWEYRAFGDTTSPSNMNKMYKEYDWNLKY
ncbi:hypothetical protein [Flavobacterium sp. 2]|uniref:hypothetical protein n=1 Tax=Flavobacterium sp. 2 TaxID=308053 RepID=UPI000C1A1FAA|nr:hypothetical protein [Flavobacterium sp. 2]PIF60240.1 zincin-like metallopeptidase toxin 3 of polymorphic toxin system [Flavobacterium sp. 2]